jgi:hypothetical protein
MKCKLVNPNKSWRQACLIVIVLGLQLGAESSRAYGDDLASVTQTPDAGQSPAQTITLQGKVHRNDTGLSGTNTEQNGAGSQEETRKLSAEAKDSAESQKLSGATSDAPPVSLRGRKMTAEDFRNLNYGILGFEITKSLWTGKQTVDEVYPGCPAALAGIRLGDVEVQTNDHVWTKGDYQRENWHIGSGQAGTPADVTIRRNGQLITFHLIRMNIEDIQNDGLRKDYENMLRKYGPSTR